MASVNSVNNAQRGFKIADDGFVPLEFWLTLAEDETIDKFNAIIQVSQNNSITLYSVAEIEAFNISSGDVIPANENNTQKYKVSITQKKLKEVTADKSLLNQSFVFRLAIVVSGYSKDESGNELGSVALEKKIKNDTLVWSEPIYKNSVSNPELTIDDTFSQEGYVEATLTFDNNETDKLDSCQVWIDNNLADDEDIIIRNNTIGITISGFNSFIDKTYKISVLYETEKGWIEKVEKSVIYTAFGNRTEGIAYLAIDVIEAQLNNEKGLVSLNWGLSTRLSEPWGVGDFTLREDPFWSSRTITPKEGDSVELVCLRNNKKINSTDSTKYYAIYGCNFTQDIEDKNYYFTIDSTVFINFYLPGGYQFQILRNNKAEFQSKIITVEKQNNSVCSNVSLRVFRNNEPLKSFIIQDEVNLNNLSFVLEDNTIEAGTTYRYDIVTYFTANNINYYIKEGVLFGQSNNITSYFDDIFLIDDKDTFRVQYDPEITGFKYNIGEALTPTLGGTYPVFRKNGQQYYRSFTLNGLISRVDSEEELSTTDSLTRTLTQGNYKLKQSDLYDYNLNAIEERKERERIFNFLYNNNFKLFKSLQEGNMVVKLTNVSFTPNKTLSRNIYNFTATVTEIADASVESLNKNVLYVNPLYINGSRKYMEYVIEGTIDQNGDLTTDSIDENNNLLITEIATTIGGDS